MANMKVLVAIIITGIIFALLAYLVLGIMGWGTGYFILAFHQVSVFCMPVREALAWHQWCVW